MPNSALKAASIQQESNSLVFDFQKEKEKRERPKFTCPSCKAKGEVCPEVVEKGFDDEVFAAMTLEERGEFLVHTRHLL